MPQVRLDIITNWDSWMFGEFYSPGLSKHLQSKPVPKGWKVNVESGFYGTKGDPGVKLVFDIPCKDCPNSTLEKLIVDWVNKNILVGEIDFLGDWEGDWENNHYTFLLGKLFKVGDAHYQSYISWKRKKRKLKLKL